MRPIESISNRLIQRAKMLVLDFDGVLTDNRVYVDRNGLETVGCWRSDGLGLQTVRALGLQLLIVSTEVDGVVVARSEKLRIPCVSNIGDKGRAIQTASETYGVSVSDMIYVGNDINDLPALELVAVPIVVADAHPDVQRPDFYVTTKPGGFGAVREVCDLISRSYEARKQLN